jgi:hypothetical protein
MLLWRFVLEADRKLDLAHPVRATAWLRAQWWGTTELPAGWAHNVLALRSLARRLKGRRGTRSVPTGDENEALADRTAYGYLRWMRLSVIQRRPGGPLSAVNFLGIKALPTYPLPPGGLPLGAESKSILARMSFEWDETDTQAMVRDVFWRDDGSVFWQIVFFGVLTDSGAAVCTLCGRGLGERTPKGQAKRQVTCRPCKQRRYWESKPLEEKRARWRADYHKRSKKRRHRQNNPQKKGDRS